ncbi:MAG: hypothetical protein ABR881_20585 [Candidatus Sulfotelmatobacter sp.]
MREIHFALTGRKGKTRKDVTIVEPTPAALSLVSPGSGSDVGIRLSTINFVLLDAGMIRSRFSGFEKNANTRAMGKGTHCSNSTGWDMSPSGNSYLSPAAISPLQSVRSCTDPSPGSA